MIIPSAVSAMSNIASLVEYEARKAGKSLIAICLLGLFLLAILTSTWLCVLTIIFVYLTSLGLTYLTTLSVILILNILILIIIALMMISYKKNLLFPETTRLFHYLPRIHKF